MKPYIKEILDVNTHYNTQEYKDKVTKAAGQISAQDQEIINDPTTDVMFEEFKKFEHQV